MRTCFKRLDADQSGTISGKDFNLIAVRFNEIGGLTGDAAQAMKDYYTNEIWKKYFKEPEKDESTEQSFINNLKKVGKKDILATTNDIHARYFLNADHNKDGLLALEEFIKYYYILGLDASLAKESFDAIDTNKDGFISRGEFITAGNDFFNSEHETKSGGLLFGPLVD